VDLAGTNNEPLTKQVPAGGGGGPQYKKYFSANNRTAKVLVPSSPMNFPVKGINFTGIGYVDNMLHIQTSVTDYLTNDNHGYFFLIDKNGNKTQCIYNVAFGEKLNDNRIVHYEEYVFDIPQSEIGQYNLKGTFVTSGLFTKGNWKVTFSLDEIKDN
jgi:hypothetical protein